MKRALVGCTGFVGSNIAASGCFDYLYNSKNISEAEGLEPDLLVYSGVRAEMFLSNQNPIADMEIIKNAAENIRKINPKQVVLISTAAVYENLEEQTEKSIMKVSGLSAYGLNRYFLECWVQDNFEDSLIVRLPALFGENLKKNFIYDLIHFIPGMLNAAKYEELSRESGMIKEAYELQENGFYKCRSLSEEIHRDLKKEFEKIGFSALNFTDSRSRYQFYNLEHLWEHIQIALDHKISKINIVTEPVAVSELYHYIMGKEFSNLLPKEPFNYNLKTVYDSLFAGKSGYIYDKTFIMNEIKEFVEKQI